MTTIYIHTLCSESWRKLGREFYQGRRKIAQHREGTAAKSAQLIIQSPLSVYAQVQSLPALYKPIMDPAWMI